MNTRTSLVIKSENEWLSKHGWKNEWPYPEAVGDDKCFSKTFECVDDSYSITTLIFRLRGEITFEVGQNDRVYTDLTLCEEDLNKVISFMYSSDLNEIFVAMSMIKNI